MWQLMAKGVIAVAGFTFWAIAARIHPQQIVGRGMGIYTFVTVLIFLTGAGLPLAVSRYARGEDSDSGTLFIWAVMATSVTSLLGALGAVVFARSFLLSKMGWLGWLPTGGYIAPSADVIGFLRTATMPALALAFLQIGLLTRITRSTMLDVLGQDYIRTARAKGLPETTVVLKHALANVMIPVITVIGLILSVLLSGSIIVETIFSVPGIGSLLGNAILRRDYPMIQGGLLFVAAGLMLLNLVVDILYGVFDPRVRVDGRG
jgi:peptide/nickel transport system permease protein